MPYSYANINSSLNSYLPAILAFLPIIILIIVLYKFKYKLLLSDNYIGMLKFIVYVLFICFLGIFLLTVPYYEMSPNNEKAKYEIISSSDIISCDYDNQTVTYMKNDEQVTEPTLITITYNEPHLEVRRYHFLGMYRDYNITLIASPDAIKVGD